MLTLLLTGLGWMNILFFFSFVHFGFQPWLRYRFFGSHFASRLQVLLSKPTSGKVGRNLVVINNRVAFSAEVWTTLSPPDLDFMM